MNTKPKYIDTFTLTEDKVLQVDSVLRNHIVLLGVNWRTGGAVSDPTDPAVHIDSMMLLIPFFTTWLNDSVFIFTDEDHWGLCTINWPLDEDFRDINYCVMADLSNSELKLFNYMQENGCPYYDGVANGGRASHENPKLSIADGVKLRAIYADYMNNLNL